MTTLYYVYARHRCYPVALCKSPKDAESIRLFVDLFRDEEFYTSETEVINARMNVLDGEEFHVLIKGVELHFKKEYHDVVNTYTGDSIYYGCINVYELDESDISVISGEEERVRFVTDDIDIFMGLDFVEIMKLHAVRDYNFCEEEGIETRSELERGFSNQSLSDDEIDHIFNFRRFEDDVFLIPDDELSLCGADRMAKYIEFK